MSQEQKLLPVEDEPKLLDRPAEERLREELEQKRNETARPGAGTKEPPPPAQPEAPKTSRKGLVIALLVAIVILAAIFLLGYLPRASRKRATETAARHEESAIPVVNVTKVRRSANVSRLLLPGNITPMIEAPIFARASGYIVKRYVDIGDHVRANQLLAVIEAPDLDQQVQQGRSQLAQARQQLGQTEAALQQAQAQLELAKVTWDRYAVLVQHGAVAKQDADTQRANYETNGATVNAQKANVRAAEDNIKAAQANLDRLIALQSYKEVRAPFNGVVTARNIDVGSYISTTGSQSGSTTYQQSITLGSNSGTPSGAIFTVAQISRLRILINTPQSDASSVKVGQNADVLVQEYSHRRFAGLVTRTANSLDPTSRTLLTEVQIDNSKGELLPGMYAQVQLSSARRDPPILVPGDALLTRSDGVFIAVLRDPSGQEMKEQDAGENRSSEHHSNPKQVHLQKVEVGRDYGVDTEITSGLQGWEYVVTNPSDEVYEGALVSPSRAQGPQAATPQNGPTDRSPAGSGGTTSPGGAPPSSAGASGGSGTTGGAGGQSGSGSSSGPSKQ